MKEVIDSILSAEEKAEQIIASANETAKKINSEKDAQSEKAKTLASLSFAAERKKEIKKAEQKAQELYQKEIESATQEAENLKQSVSNKIDILVDQLVDGLIK